MNDETEVFTWTMESEKDGVWKTEIGNGRMRCWVRGELIHDEPFDFARLAIDDRKRGMPEGYTLSISDQRKPEPLTFGYGA